MRWFVTGESMNPLLFFYHSELIILQIVVKIMILALFKFVPSGSIVP